MLPTAAFFDTPSHLVMRAEDVVNNAVLAVLLLASVLCNERGQKLLEQKKAKRVRSLTQCLTFIHV